MNIVSIFNSVLEISMFSTIVGIVIILLRQLLKGRVNSKWIYLIWFILLFRLLIPFKIESTYSIFNFTPSYIEQSNIIEESRNEYEDLKEKYNNKLSNENIQFNNNVIVQEEINIIEEELEKSENKNFVLESLIPGVWLFGTFLIIFWFITSNIILTIRLKRNIKKDDRIEEILQSCKLKMKVNKDVRILINDIVATPALFGLFKSKILIPNKVLELSSKNIEYIILHELSHYKRKDILINYILILIQAIHWFNPIIWLCFKLIRNDLELATDEFTLKYLEKNEYNLYANSLIEVLNVYSNMKFIPKLVGMVDNKENIKRRIIMIKSLEIFKKKKIIISIVCMILIISFSIVLLTTPKTTNEKNGELLASSLSDENRELIKEKEIIEVDNSKKIAKLNTLSDWNEDNESYNTVFVKDISENQVKEIDNIIQRGEKLLASVSWAKKADYTITFNDKMRKEINIRIFEDGTIGIDTFGESMSVYTIYSEKDVKYMLNLFGHENKYKNISTINLANYSEPINIYWYGGTEFELGTYVWNDSSKNSSMEEVSKRIKTTTWSVQGAIVTINSREVDELKKLPDNAILKYRICKENEDISKIEYETATKMIDGAFYLNNLPKIKGDYIVELNLSFNDISTNVANYYIKVNI